MSKIQYTKLREKPCGYNHSMIKRLRMLETTKGFISTSDNKIDVYMYHDTLKIIDVNPSSLSFTDSFNGDTYEQTLSFEIPLINYQFYFHYNVLEYINNRYYCIIETTDGKYIVGGYKSGMFPSYAIEGNNIIITLKTNTISNNTLIADYISFNEIEYNHCMGIDGECIDGLWTYKLIQRLNLDGSVSDEHYALNGYENDYTDINIVGTYSRFDTVFGIKLTNPLYDCFKQCYISGLPSSLIFKNTLETQCYVIDSDCDFTYTYDVTVIDASFNEDTNEMCVTSLKMDSSTQIKITTSDGIDRFINVIIGTVGGEEGEYDRIYRWYYNGETYCLDENQQINCESAVTIPNEIITSGACAYYKTELYISPLCDGNYDFYGYGIGDLIGCEKIYRWVLSTLSRDYYCDENTHTKYAIEYEEYSYDNGLTWVRTDNSRKSDTILNYNSTDCGYSGNTGGSYKNISSGIYDGFSYIMFNQDINSSIDSCYEVVARDGYKYFLYLDNDSEFCKYINIETETVVAYQDDLSKVFMLNKDCSFDINSAKVLVQFVYGSLNTKVSLSLFSFDNEEFTEITNRTNVSRVYKKCNKLYSNETKDANGEHHFTEISYDGNIKDITVLDDDYTNIVDTDEYGYNTYSGKYTYNGNTYIVLDTNYRFLFGCDSTNDKLLILTNGKHYIFNNDFISSSLLTSSSVFIDYGAIFENHFIIGIINKSNYSPIVVLDFNNGNLSIASNYASSTYSCIGYSILNYSSKYELMYRSYDTLYSYKTNKEIYIQNEYYKTIAQGNLIKFLVDKFNITDSAFISYNTPNSSDHFTYQFDDIKNEVICVGTGKCSSGIKGNVMMLFSLSLDVFNEFLNGITEPLQ